MNDAIQVGPEPSFAYFDEHPCWKCWRCWECHQTLVGPYACKCEFRAQSIYAMVQPALTPEKP